MRFRALIRDAVLALVLLTVAGATAATAAPSPQGASGSDRQWVFFADKGLDRAGEELAIQEFRAELSERALWRRAKAGLDVNVNDLPVSPAYVAQVRATGAEVDRQPMDERGLRACR